MTEPELLKILTERGAIFAPPMGRGKINLINMNLQKIRAATLPSEFIKFYQICGGIKLSNGYIFGPKENAIIANESGLPVLCINERNDLYVLCT